MVDLILVCALGLFIPSLGWIVVRTVNFAVGPSNVRAGEGMLVCSILGHGVLAFAAGLSVMARVPLRVSLMVLVTISLVVVCTEVLSTASRHEILRRWQSTSWITRVLSAGLLFVTGTTGLQSAANLCDDVGRYFYMAERLWYSGNLFDPFNNWRSATTGGSLYLQSLGLRLDSLGGPVALDLVSAQILILGLSKSLRSRSSKLMVISYGVLMAMTNFAGIAPTNSVPRYTPALLMAGVLLLASRSLASEQERVVPLLAIAAGVATVSSIRLQFAVFLVICVVGVLLIKRELRVLLLVGPFGGLLILPWLIASFRDTGTPLFPLLRGNSDPGWTGASLPSEVARTVVDRFLEVEGLRYVLIIGLVVWLGRSALSRFEKPTVRVVGGSALVTSALFASMATSNEQADISRYLAPIVLASIICIGTTLTEHVNVDSSTTGLRVLAVVVVGSFGMSGSSIGVENLPETLVSRVSATARLLTSISPKLESPSKSQIERLIQETPRGSRVLTAIDESELALDPDREVGILGMPGWAYPRPHNLPWKSGLSPSSDMFEVSFHPADLELLKVYPLVSFGTPYAADLVGARRTNIGIEFVLDHWGSPLVVGAPMSVNREQSVQIQVDIDRRRGLVQFRSATGFSETLSPKSGRFFNRMSPYFLGSNPIGFTTVERAALVPRVVGVTAVPNRGAEYFRSMTAGLKEREVDFLLVVNSGVSSCLYSEKGWKSNATSPNLYQMHSPYLFAWFDLVEYLLKTHRVVSIGNHSLIDLRE